MKSDTELLADVQTELDWDPSFDDRGIVVAVKDGVRNTRRLGAFLPGQVVRGERS